MAENEIRSTPGKKSKLSKSAYIEMLESRARGVSLSVLSGKYGIDKSLISRICSREAARIEDMRIR